MAVTPVGNPHVESSDLVANYPGVSEALAERIDIVGVNPFADSAARATAIPSPVEGQMASLNDDNKVYRYDGASWKEIGGGLALLGQTSGPGVSSLQIDGVFSATYQNYRVIVNTTSQTAAAEMRLRVRAGGTALTASQYLRQDLNGTGGTASAAALTYSYMRMTNGTTATESNFCFDFLSPFEARRAYMTGLFAQPGSISATNYIINNSNAYDGIEIFPASGTFVSSLRVYGYLNS